MVRKLQRQTLLYALIAAAGVALIAGAAALSCMRLQKPFSAFMAIGGGLLLVLSRGLYMSRLRRLARRPTGPVED